MFRLDWHMQTTLKHIYIYCGPAHRKPKEDLNPLQGFIFPGTYRRVAKIFLLVWINQAVPLKISSPKKYNSVIISSPYADSFVVHKMFLELHGKTALQHSPEQEN